MLILGTVAASAISSNLGDFESIATVTVGSGGAASVEFTSIPSTYTHLEVRFIARNNNPADASVSIRMQINNDTGSNYSYHFLVGGGSSTTVEAQINQSNVWIAGIPGGIAPSNVFGTGVVSILDYKNTNKYKTIRTLGGEDRNGAGLAGISSGSWRNTNAITSLKFFTVSNSLVQ